MKDEDKAELMADAPGLLEQEATKLAEEGMKALIKETIKELIGTGRLRVVASPIPGLPPRLEID